MATARNMVEKGKDMFIETQLSFFTSACYAAQTCKSHAFIACSTLLPSKDEKFYFKNYVCNIEISMIFLSKKHLKANVVR